MLKLSLMKGNKIEKIIVFILDDKQGDILQAKSLAILKQTILKLSMFQ